jgi:hypothetical protein
VADPSGEVAESLPYVLSPLAFESSFVGFNDVEDGFEEP